MLCCVTLHRVILRYITLHYFTLHNFIKVIGICDCRLFNVDRSFVDCHFCFRMFLFGILWLISFHKSYSERYRPRIGQRQQFIICVLSEIVFRLPFFCCGCAAGLWRPLRYQAPRSARCGVWHASRRSRWRTAAAGTELRRGTVCRRDRDQSRRSPGTSGSRKPSSVADWSSLCRRRPGHRWRGRRRRTEHWRQSRPPKRQPWPPAP